MKRLLIGTILTFMMTTGFAEIRKANSLSPIQQEIKRCHPKTLVLLDIGGTLLSNPDAVLHKAHETWKLKWFQSNYPDLTREEAITLFKDVTSNAKNWNLLDSNWPSFITGIQSRNLKVIAFTRVFVDDSLKGLSVKTLKEFGLPIKDDLSALTSGDTFEYADGIIETEAPLKGPVLKEVLAKMPKEFEQIIFVDDREEQIRSVEQACRELRIPCVAFHYTPSKEAPKLNEKIADYQLKTLVHEHRWVSEREASDLIAKQAKSALKQN